MTMHYAQTLQSTAEAEFLRYRKLTADARDAGIDPTDLYDMLQLGQRTDRMLPNGYCLLPPRQACGKANAPLTELTSMFLQFMARFRSRTLTCPRDRIG